MEGKRITLPERDEMLRRLTGVIDVDYVTQNFYPLLLKDAGEPKTAAGLALMFQLAIFDYAADKPAPVKRTLNVAVPRFLAALTDDADFQREVLSVMGIEVP
jgi:hypothetical protein